MQLGVNQVLLLLCCNHHSIRLLSFSLLIRWCVFTYTLV